MVSFYAAQIWRHNHPSGKAGVWGWVLDNYLSCKTLLNDTKCREEETCPLMPTDQPLVKAVVWLMGSFPHCLQSAFLSHWLLLWVAEGDGWCLGR